MKVRGDVVTRPGMLACMEFGSSDSTIADPPGGVRDAVVAMVAEFELQDYSELDASGVIKRVLQTDTVRRQIEAHLAGLLVRLGELAGDDTVEAVCQQFGLASRKAKRQAKTAKGLRALPDVLDAAKDGFITMDHAELIAASHERAPLRDGDGYELVKLALTQSFDQFRRSLATRENQRMAAGGMTRTERQHARRTAKVFDGDNDMVILHAELDTINGQRVKTALSAMNTRLLHHDSQVGQERPSSNATRMPSSPSYSNNPDARLRVRVGPIAGLPRRRRRWWSPPSGIPSTGCSRRRTHRRDPHRDRRTPPIGL